MNRELVRAQSAHVFNLALGLVNGAITQCKLAFACCRHAAIEVFASFFPRH